MAAKKRRSRSSRRGSRSSRRAGNVRKIRKPTFPACKTGFTGYGHDRIAWTCRYCGREACSMCAHRFGTARTPVSITGPHERIFTCLRCIGDRAKDRGVPR